ncbi:MAG: cysteine--tRNA ligase [Candidatus Andersenbacteria bacterium]
MLRLYDTLTKKVRPFKPLKAGPVTIYSCGPTVYNYQHIGNMRKYLADDVLVRVLQHAGFAVRRIVNITDVGHLTQDEFDQGEDKIVMAARKEGKSPLAIAEFYTKFFLEDLARLHAVPPESYIRATDHIAEMQALTTKLVKKKHAYQTAGGVYFDVNSFADYGKLSGNSIETLRERVRSELQDAETQEAFAEKRHPVDFALWIKAKPNHILQWPSPWGAGYPGWHIECAAMILKHLGPTIDIHTGGEDHIFPHHEDEIAEAEAATGKPLANFWLHVRHLFVDGKKMAKRTGSFVRLADLEARGINPLAFRYLVLSTHYRTRLNFTWASLAAANEGWQRFVDVVQRLRENPLAKASAAPTAAGVPATLTQRLTRIKKDFWAALEDDLATPKALASLSEFIGVANTYVSGHATLAVRDVLLQTALEFDEVLAVLPETQEPLPTSEYQKLQALLAKRQQLRSQKKYPESDAVRAEIEQLGFSIQDSQAGVRWVKRATGQSATFAQDGG